MFTNKKFNIWPYAMVITSAQLYETEPGLRFCAALNPNCS